MRVRLCCLSQTGGCVRLDNHIIMMLLLDARNRWFRPQSLLTTLKSLLAALKCVSLNAEVCSCLATLKSGLATRQRLFCCWTQESDGSDLKMRTNHKLLSLPENNCSRQFRFCARALLHNYSACAASRVLSECGQSTVIQAPVSSRYCHNYIFV